MQKKYLELLFKVVKGYKTPEMALARVRDSFLKELAPQVDQYFKDREEVFKSFSKKKEDGTPDTLEVDGVQKYQFPTDKTEEINKELVTLGDETVELKKAPELKNIIEESSYETEVGETIQIDEIIAKL